MKSIRANIIIIIMIKTVSCLCVCVCVCVRARARVCTRDMRNAYKILVRKPEENKSVGGPSCRWEDNIKMNLRKMWLEDVVWICLALDRILWLDFVNTLTKLKVQ
jgi:hypothetical protein